MVCGTLKAASEFALKFEDVFAGAVGFLVGAAVVGGDVTTVVCADVGAVVMGFAVAVGCDVVAAVVGAEVVAAVVDLDVGLEVATATGLLVGV